MTRAGILAIALGALTGCVSGDVDTSPVPLCGPLETQAKLPEICAPGELDEFSNALSARIPERARRTLVRVELDDAARVRAVCVEEGPGYAPASARRALAESLDAIRALPPGPPCASGKRVDLNRYNAAEAEVRERETRCREQTRVTRETHGNTIVRERTVPGAYGVYEREFEHCLDHDADWIVLDARGSTRPWIYVKPEIPNPPGPRAYETASRCARESRVLEKQAACIEAEGWERLVPPR